MNFRDQVDSGEHLSQQKQIIAWGEAYDNVQRFQSIWWCERRQSAWVVNVSHGLLYIERVALNPKPLNDQESFFIFEEVSMLWSTLEQ